MVYLGQRGRRSANPLGTSADVSGSKAEVAVGVKGYDQPLVILRPLRPSYIKIANSVHSRYREFTDVSRIQGTVDKLSEGLSISFLRV